MQAILENKSKENPIQCKHYRVSCWEELPLNDNPCILGDFLAVIVNELLGLPNGMEGYHAVIGTPAGRLETGSEGSVFSSVKFEYEELSVGHLLCSCLTALLFEYVFTIHAHRRDASDFRNFLTLILLRVVLGANVVQDKILII